MWQTLIVVVAVALAGWYVFRRLRRTIGSGQNGACTCGGHEGPCPLTQGAEAPQPSLCQDCASCPQPGDNGANDSPPKK